jgi:hypothetical protein
LPEQAGIGHIGPAAEQQKTHDCWGAHCVVRVIVFEFEIPCGSRDNHVPAESWVTQPC